MASNGDPYILSREKPESKRLEEQHELHKLTFEYLVPSRVIERLPSNPRIADVATGTGIFLVELAQQLPDAQLDGFDISSAQFPAQDGTPHNVHFHLQNAKEPFPSELHGQYDLVHISLIMAAMTLDDWEIVARNVLPLLKPGGAIHWVESDFSQLLPALRGKQGATVDKIEDLYRRLFDVVINQMGRMFPLYSSIRLDKILRDLGVEDIEVDVRSTDRLPELREWATSMEIRVAMGAVKMGGASEETLAELQRGAESDARSGAYTRWDVHNLTGFKK